MSISPFFLNYDVVTVVNAQSVVVGNDCGGGVMAGPRKFKHLPNPAPQKKLGNLMQGNQPTNRHSLNPNSTITLRYNPQGTLTTNC